jgi:hypothetical protein
MVRPVSSMQPQRQQQKPATQQQQQPQHHWQPESARVKVPIGPHAIVAPKPSVGAARPAVPKPVPRSVFG